MKVLGLIATLILLLNCKISEKANQQECEPTKYCIINIHIADSLYENSEPFTVIKELNNPFNGAMTDFEGNATLKMTRPMNDSLGLVIGLMGISGGDTIYLVAKKCIEVYNYDYYLPKWYKDYSKKNPVIMKKYNPDLNYGNE